MAITNVNVLASESRNNNNTENERKEIDPRLFMVICQDIENMPTFSSSFQSSSYQDNMSSLVLNNSSSQVNAAALHLPLDMMYRFQWKANNGEQIPIKATLVYVSPGNKQMLHYIHPNVHFPDRFSGKYFKTLSSSSLYIKPVEQNGFTVWVFWNGRSNRYAPMKDARDIGFLNKFNTTPDVSPMAPKITKEDLYRNEDMAQQALPMLLKNGGKNSGSTGKRSRVVEIRPFATSAAPVVTLTWMSYNSVKLLLDYLVEIFLCNTNLVALDGIPVSPISSLSLAPSPNQVFGTGNLNKIDVLGCLIMTAIQKKQLVGCIMISTNAVDMKTIIRNNTSNEHLTLSLCDLIQFQGSNQCMQLYPFALDQNTLSIHSTDKTMVLKTVFISNIVQELARKRHATVEDTKFFEMSTTPDCFINIPTSVSHPHVSTTTDCYFK